MNDDGLKTVDNSPYSMPHYTITQLSSETFICPPYLLRSSAEKLILNCL
jgi:hypothetical protein